MSFFNDDDEDIGIGDNSGGNDRLLVVNIRSLTRSTT